MNFFELDISYFQRAQQLTFQEILILGLFHGIVFSLPFSAPLLICFRRFLLDGIKSGFSALLGTVFGQLTFLLFIFLGFRPLIQCWYIFEPFLAFLGMSLTLKLATDFFHQRNFGLETGGNVWSNNVRTSLRFTSMTDNLPNALKSVLKPFITIFNSLPMPVLVTGKIFFFQFLLMFLNPAFPATISRFILSQDLFDGLSVELVGGVAATSPFSFVISYSFGFILGSIFFVGLFVFLLKVVTTQLENFSVGQMRTGTKVGVSSPSVLVQFSTFARAIGNPFFLNKAFVFLIIGCLLQGTIQYSWRLFTQYPLEFVMNPTESSQVTATSSSSAFNPMEPGLDKQSSGTFFQREFPSFDSNIRHRDKNLPVDRHVPVEKVNARRTLSGRPPLTEEQKSDAYLKYNSFFLNKLEQAIEDSKIQYKTPDLHIRTYQDIVQLQKMKERYLKAQAFFSGYGLKLGKPQFNQSSVRGDAIVSLNADPKFASKARPIENNTKGKPKFSYIRELVDKPGSLVGKVAINNNGTSAVSSLTSPYVHDDIQIYNAVFKLIGS